MYKVPADVPSKYTDIENSRHHGERITPNNNSSTQSDWGDLQGIGLHSGRLSASDLRCATDAYSACAKVWTEVMSTVYCTVHS